MSHTNEIPTFAELTTIDTNGPPGDRFCPEGIAVAKQRWLQHIEHECARLTSEYRTGNTYIKFDPSALYDEECVKLAEQQGIDYVGICLLHNEMYERNPFSHEQKVQERYRKRWFAEGYVTDSGLLDKIRVMVKTIALLKQQLRAGPSEGWPN